MSRSLLLIGLFLLVLAQLLTVTNCANPIAPQGGPRDSIPPQIVVEESTPNFRTNFRPEQIDLTFDEWVRLENARQQLIISPPLRPLPEIRLRKKTVQLVFADTIQWRENATYVINLGTAVQDLTERNPAVDLRYVFSTGPVIDSLAVKGRVVEAYTGEPVKDISVQLYEELADSVVRTELPFYVARTREDGTFTVKNLKPGTFRILALEDQRNDYLYKESAERIAFPDSVIVVAPGDTSDVGTLRIFAPELPFRRLKFDTSRYGRIAIAYSRPPYEVTVRSEPPIALLPPTVDGDSLEFYYDAVRTETTNLILSRDTSYQDTLRLGLGRREAFRQTDTVRITGRGATQSPFRPLRLQFSQPLDSVVSSGILLLADTLEEPVNFTLQVDTTDRRFLLVNSSWRDELPYRFQALPGSVVDFFGVANRDTINYAFRTDARDNFGNLRLTFLNANPDEQYVIRLLTGKSDLVETFVLANLPTYERTLTGYPPAEYSLEVILDTNRNGRYDVGDYFLARQPEIVRRVPLERLRANWDLEVDIDLGVGE